MKTTKVGRVTFHTLTNEEALQKYGTSFVFVGNPPPRPAEAQAVETLKPAENPKQNMEGNKQ
jgi:hypothetical protein